VEKQKRRRNDNMWKNEVRFWKRIAFMSSEKKHEKVLDIEWKGNMEPVTWGVIAIEINGRTPLGKRMLEELDKKELLW